MKIKDLIKLLETLDQEKEIKVASDEEWNTIFENLEINQDGLKDQYIISGL